MNTNADHNLIAKNLHIILDLAVYTISGIAVWNGTAETETVITLDKGVYVVTVGGKTFKVAI